LNASVPVTRSVLTGFAKTAFAERIATTRRMGRFMGAKYSRSLRLTI
jgi:hypothetical protein